MSEEIAVWFAGGIPVRLVWGGVRYRVNDVPTPLTPADVWWPPLITHPPIADWRGWRFQAVDESGLAAVFDIREVVRERSWELVGVYGDGGTPGAVVASGSGPRAGGRHRRGAS